jgi:hypothetical protein
LDPFNNSNSIQISKEPKKQTKKKEKEKSKQKVSTNTSNNTDSSNKNNELRVSIKGEELSDNEAELPGYTKQEFPIIPYY